MSSARHNASTTGSTTGAQTPQASGQGSQIQYREVRAVYDDRTITVYQAYSAEIAVPAVTEQRLSASSAFSVNRMTWIKPSFMWMMYRSGFSYKDPRQAHILALRLTRTCFEELLSQASVTHGAGFKPEDKACPVRVQWDPERSIKLERLPFRSIQIGIGREVSKAWVEGGGIVEITDVTGLARRIKELIDNGKVEEAENLLPDEKPYPLPEYLRERLKVDEQSYQ